MAGGGAVGAKPRGSIVLKESEKLAEASVAGSGGIWVWGTCVGARGSVQPYFPGH